MFIAPALATALSIGGNLLPQLGTLFRKAPPKQTYVQSSQEREYLNFLENMKRRGLSPAYISNIENRATRSVATMGRNQDIAMQGRHLRAGTQGVASRQMENISQQNVLRALADVSAGAQEKSELAKMQASETLGKYGMQKSERDSQMRYANAMAKYQHKGSQMNALLNIFGSGMSGFGDYHGGGQKSDEAWYRDTYA